MITPKVLEPPTEADEVASLDETIGWLERAILSGDPTGNIARTLSKLRDARATASSRPHRGLVDYDQRVHG
jgi:hypothetical protein